MDNETIRAMTDDELARHATANPVGTPSSDLARVELEIRNGRRIADRLPAWKGLRPVRRSRASAWNGRHGSFLLQLSYNWHSLSYRLHAGTSWWFKANQGLWRDDGASSDSASICVAQVRFGITHKSRLPRLNDLHKCSRSTQSALSVFAWFAS